ncbi:MAG: thioredoxin family protein [Solirubrobacterales bacterium]
MLRARFAPAAITLACASIALGACGEGEQDQEVEDVGAAAPAVDAFPAASGGSLEDLLAEATPTNEIVVAPAGQVYTPGTNRFGFGVFTVAQEQITDAEVALYAAPGPDGEATGPFPARIDSLETEPAFEARTTADDPDSAKAVYVTEIPFDQPGEWRLIAMIREGDELLASRLHSIIVGDYSKIPAVGEKAPVIHTPTVSDVGDVAEIDTRNPHDTMHDVDAADTIGSEPTVLLFATPALCVSRTCGPVVDAAEQVKSELGEDAAFIHMEVYEKNDPNEGLRSQLREYGLRTEPWLFVTDANGEVTTRIEGAFSVEELRRAVERASS